ncbi:MAG: NAD(P)H-dependent oxidoreductase [Actinomycetota bacterium]|nr:NAD(P)H-dependent oxidoreductase [Actinomycetota bacterium]
MVTDPDLVQGGAVKLKAVLLNCTLKKSPAVSNTQALMDRVIGILEGLEVECETVRVVDYDVRFGVSSDEGDGDQWPLILEKIAAADILIVGMSIWFGVRCSVAQMVIERLDGTYNSTNAVGQYPMYNKVGGVVVTGNEDGAHACAETTLFNLSHLGFTIPPNADTYWVGDAGPGPSYIEAQGAEHAYTQKTSSWMAHNVVHMARLLKEHPIPPEGNTVPGWQPDECRGHDDRMPAGHVG